MSKEKIVRLVEKVTKYKVTDVDGTVPGALRDIDGVALDFASFHGYESVGKLIYKGNASNSRSMRLNAKKKLFSKNKQNVKIYGYTTSKHNYLMMYDLDKPLVDFKVFNGSRLVHKEYRSLISIKDYAKEFENKG